MCACSQPADVTAFVSRVVPSAVSGQAGPRASTAAEFQAAVREHSSLYDEEDDDLDTGQLLRDRRQVPGGRPASTPACTTRKTRSRTGPTTSTATPTSWLQPTTPTSATIRSKAVESAWTWPALPLPDLAPSTRPALPVITSLTADCYLTAYTRLRLSASTGGVTLRTRTHACTCTHGSTYTRYSSNPIPDRGAPSWSQAI
jgi:hypothetical protein